MGVWKKSPEKMKSIASLILRLYSKTLRESLKKTTFQRQKGLYFQETWDTA